MAKLASLHTQHHDMSQRIKEFLVTDLILKPSFLNKAIEGKLEDKNERQTYVESKLK